MTGTIRTLGILTGGGDCPGLNACIRAVAKTAIHKHGLRVVGIHDGFQGLIEHRVDALSFDDVSGIMTRGGTILGTNNRCNPVAYRDGTNSDGSPRIINAVDRCMETVETNEIDALIVIGGDGTMACTTPLAEAGVRCIGVPKTIDNDIIGTQLTVGFTSALRIGAMALDRLHSTASSHHRVMVCELMGRNAGWLALAAGVASGADVILLPEIPFDIDTVCSFVTSRTDDERGFSIIACGEGARFKDGEQVVARRVEDSPDPVRLGGVGAMVSWEIEQRTGIESRTTVLGHVQRGGEPSATDRTLATLFGTAAVELVMGGATNRMVALSDGVISDAPLSAAAGTQRLVPMDDPLLSSARSVNTCFGD